MKNKKYNPPFLSKGDTIAVVAPAGKIDKQRVLPATYALEKAGFKVVTGSHLFCKDRIFAGTDEQRAIDFQWALDNNEVKAIVCARGGYGTIRTFEKLNWNKFLMHPKWIVGFSDITVLHSFLNNQHIASLHSPMPITFLEDKKPVAEFYQMLDLLSGKKEDVTWHCKEENKIGIAKGELIGGNLSILYSLRGTPFDINYKNKILFLEDLDEYHYHMERMLQNFKWGQCFDQLSGMILGQFTDMKEGAKPFERTPIQIVQELSERYSFPIAYNFPAGHVIHNTPFILGVDVELNVKKHSATLKYL